MFGVQQYYIYYYYINIYYIIIKYCTRVMVITILSGGWAKSSDALFWLLKV